MDSISSPGHISGDGSPCSSPLPGSTRRTSHTGKQGGLTGLGYGVGVACTQMRPFIPFFLISCLVVALIYLLQTIVYGGPLTDPLFFAKFSERWPRPDPPVSSTLTPTLGPALTPDPVDHTRNGTI